MAIYDYTVIYTSREVVHIALPHGPLDYNAKFDGRYDRRLDEMKDWLRDAERPGAFAYMFGGGDDHQSLYVFISDEDVAIEGKLRWSGAFTNCALST